MFWILTYGGFIMILSYFVEKVVFRKSISYICKSREDELGEDKLYAYNFSIVESVFR